MPSVNFRGFAWTDESAEHSDEDQRRAEALMRRWSTLHHEAEQRMFRMQADIEDGRDDGPEPDPCETCGGECELLAASHPRNSHGHPLRYSCGEQGCNGLVNIKCPNPNCEDGYDVSHVREIEKSRQQRRDDHDLEVELIERMLAEIGARPMRPYEHWNEDEAYMQYMEEGRFGHYSS